MKISDLKKYKLKSELTICEKERPVSEIAREMRDRNIGAIPITENNKLIGIVSERDIVTRLVLEGKRSRFNYRIGNYDFRYFDGDRRRYYR